jgi:hypothetical protein
MEPAKTVPVKQAHKRQNIIMIRFDLFMKPPYIFVTAVFLMLKNYPCPRDSLPGEDHRVVSVIGGNRIIIADLRPGSTDLN